MLISDSVLAANKLPLIGGKQEEDEAEDGDI